MVWRKILQLKELAQQMRMKMIIGNGEDTFMWLDNWHPLRPLIKCTSARAWKAFPGGRHAKVSLIIINNKWKWPEGRKQNVEVRRIIETMPISLIPKIDQNDQLQWIPNELRSFYSGFSYPNFMRKPKHGRMEQIDVVEEL